MLLLTGEKNLNLSENKKMADCAVLEPGTDQVFLSHAALQVFDPNITRQTVVQKSCLTTEEEFEQVPQGLSTVLLQQNDDGSYQKEKLHLEVSIFC